MELNLNNATDIIDVLIIGAGPAGLSAAVYTSRAGLETTVLTGHVTGGLLTTTEEVDNYLGMPGTTGMDMAQVFSEHAVKFGAELLDADATRVIKQTGDAIGDNNSSNSFQGAYFMTTVNDGSGSLNEVRSRSVIYAAGSTPKKLGVPGEDLSGVSYCATCDGMFFAKQDVAVVGGGETAVEEALYLSQLANSVTVLVRDDFRATQPAVEKLSSVDNVNIRKQTSIVSIQEDTDSGQAVSSVVLDDNSTLDVSGVFVAIGQSPNNEVATPHSTLFSDGFIQCSNVDGFFVAGDITDPEYRQVAIAVGDGAKAGIDATRYLV